MFITRRTAFEKILRKSNDVMKNIMNMYRQKYNINVTKRAPGSQLDSKTITIPRIAACFPAITVGLFHHGIGRSIIDPEVLFPGLEPRALFSTMIGSMIPVRDNAPLAVLLSIAVRNDDILHQIDRKTGLSALYTCLLLIILMQ